MISHTEAEKGGSRAVQTNGIGQSTTAHLNLTRSLAQANEPRNRFAAARTLDRAEKRAKRRYERQSNTKIKFAGREGI